MFDISVRRVSYTVHFVFFFFNDTATTEIYTLSLHDALPIWFLRRAASRSRDPGHGDARLRREEPLGASAIARTVSSRSEEHTSELQSQSNLVCRLLLEKKKKASKSSTDPTVA